MWNAWNRRWTASSWKSCALRVKTSRSTSLILVRFDMTCSDVTADVNDVIVVFDFVQFASFESISMKLFWVLEVDRFWRQVTTQEAEVQLLPHYRNPPTCQVQTYFFYHFVFQFFVSSTIMLLKKKQLSWTQICENPRLFLCLDHAELASRINRARVLGGSDIFPDSSRSFTGSLFRGSPSSQPSLSTSQQPSIQVQQPQQQPQQQQQQQHPFLR